MAAFMNDSEISSIIEACRCVGGDKITERRKNVEVLERLLLKQSIVKVLDENTDSNHGFTWNDVFKAACNFLNKEVEKYRLEEGKGTATTQKQKTLRENHLQAGSNCLLNVIKAAKQDQPMLDVDVVLHHCLMVLKDSLMLEKFGRDHLAVLNREILSKRGYWSKLKPNLWLSIFLMALKLFKSKLPNNVTYTSLATLLNYVMHHGTHQSDISIKIKKKISFFIEALNNKAMLNKEHNLLKVWLDSTVELGFAIGFEDRLQLCMLSEATLNTFLDLCHDHLDNIDLIAQFSILAMIAHHPFGVEIGDSDFMAFNGTEEWLKLLRRLHSFIDFIIKINIQKNRTAEKKMYELEANQISLAVRVSRQVFSSAEMLTMEVTRMGEMDATSALSSSLTSGPSAKKKRLMSGFSELIERLKSIGQSKESIPWLQIASHLISAHPGFAETHEMKEILNYTVDVTHECREYDLVSHCYRLFRIVCVALFEHRSDFKELVQSSFQSDNITKLWESVWKCLAANHCHNESFLLMATLMYYRLATGAMARQVIQQLVRPGQSVPCDRFSMICLAAYLQRYKLPERSGFNSATTDQLSLTLSWNNDPVGDRSVRSLLSEWLLHRQGQDYEPGNQLHLKLFAALSMKQPTLPGVDLPALLAHPQSPSSFDLRCSKLESTFRHIDLLDREDSIEAARSTEKPLDTFPKSASVLEEQISHASDLCVSRGVYLEGLKSITPDLITVLDDAICLLSLTRDLTLSRVVEENCSLRPLSINLLTAIMSLVLNEDTVYSRNCMMSLSAMFLSCPKQEKLGEDFLRPTAWELCGQRMIRLSTKESGGDIAFGDVRRGGASRPSLHSEPVEEDKQASLFDSSILNDFEAWQVELYRLMAVISCPPVIQSEEASAKYLLMKTELIQMLSSSGINPSSYTFLQMSFCLLRPFARSIPQSIDNNLLRIVVELLSDLGRRFIHDHEAAVAILELVPAASKHIQSSGCFVTKRRIIDLLIEFQNGVRDDLFGPPVERAFYRCLAELPIADWVVWDAGSLETTSERQSPIALELIAGLDRPLSSTAFAAGQVISQVFQGNCSWQETVLSTLSSVLLVPLEGLDQRETTIKNSIVLQAFSSIAVKSLWAEKPALITLLRFAKIRNINTETLQKVLELTARQLEVDYAVWTDSRLEFLLDRWLDSDTIDTFPYGVYQVTSLANFIEKYEGIIVPLLFLKKDHAALERVTSSSRSLVDVILQHLPALLAKILPRLAESRLRTEGIGAPIDRFAQTKYQELVQIIVDKARFARELEENLLELVSRLLFVVYDPQVASQLFDLDVVLPVPGSFRFDKKSITDALRYFSPETMADPHLEMYDALLQWTSTRPWEVHTLIVELFVSYETGCRLTDKQQAMVRIAAACELLVTALVNVPTRANMLFYVFYSFVVRLGHIVRNGAAHETLRRSAMITVKELLAIVLPEQPDFVAQLAVTVVGYVTPLAKGTSHLQWLAMSILEFLIVDHRKQLESVMNQLSPFPKLPQFTHLSQALESTCQRKSIRQEIEVFLNLVDSLGHDNVPVESIENIARLLGERKEELSGLYENLNEVEFHSPIHKLICCLINLAKIKGLGDAVATALGELGPADLSTFILQPDNPIPDKGTLKGQMESHAQNHPILQQAMAIFPLLVRYLFASDSVQLMAQSGKVMLNAMGTVEGQQFGALTKKYSWPSYNLTAPFRIKPQVEQKDVVLDYNYFEENIDDAILWATSTRSSWLIRLTCTLINCMEEPNFYATLLPVCRLQPDFCSKLLPFVVRAVLDAGDQKTRRIISRHINALFTRCNDWTGKSANPCIKNLLAVVQYLRTVEKSKKPDGKWESNFRLELNYSDAARAAQSCSAFFTTIMFVEIWLDRLNTTGHSESIDGTEDKGFRKADQLMDLLYDAYVCTGELDACTGFQSLLSDVRRFEQETSSFRALECHDAMASFDDSIDDRHTPILSALTRCGLYKTANDLSNGYGTSSAAVREYQYQCAWRLGNWDRHHVMDCSDDKPGFHQSVFNALFALKQGDHLELANQLTESRSIVIDQLRKAGSLESCRVIYPALSCLRVIQDVEDFHRHSKELVKLREKWSQSVQTAVSDFDLLEPSLAVRAVMLKEFLPASGEASSALNEVLIDTCRKARQFKSYPLAGRCLMQISTIPTLNKESQLVCRLEQALTEWQRKDTERALNIVRSLSVVMERDYPSHGCYPLVLSLAGQWMHESRCENPRQILSLYLKKSLDAAVAFQSRKQWTDVKHGPSAFGVSDARQVLASYADSLYKDLHGYTESRDFETQQKLTKIRQQQADELKKLKAPSERRDDVRRANFFMTNETTKDKTEFETLFQERETYLLQAVENYLIGIKEETGRANQNSAFDVRISRLISLWFDNRANANLTELLMKHLGKLPSYLFLPVLPQLAARLVSKPNPSYHEEFPKLLSNLIEKCAIEHPHHTLPVLMALAMTNRDKEIQEGNQAQVEDDRVITAKKLIQKMAKRSESSALCKKLEQLHGSLIQLANKEVNTRDRGEDSCKLPTDLANLKGMEDVAVPTVTLAVRPDGVYDDIIGIVSFEPVFQLVGGINAPKKMACLGTDGRTRPMLLKGKDDLRQDAVMQQVFSTMTLFLEQDEEARRRKLNMRKYKVVPLSRRSGLLEWCEGTLPIGLYLIGKDSKSGAHLRYRRGDELTTEEAIREVAKLVEVKHVDQKLRLFKEICARFPPVFRHFFLERYSAPSLWFEKRLSYTRSVAASSMVGYILGLGDRHLQNILIDEQTAELIHIDLGIAFDQGTVLPTPETVPFRLTRDIVDAMGVLGVEGVFRRCCKFTMEVMRKQQDSILTLLEVLLYDPLYVWTVTPQKAAAVQQKQKGLIKRRGSVAPESVAEYDGVDTQVNESAKRTLVRLSQKLKGVEKGTPLSVDGQVNLLIQQANDPANLSRIYHGWKPQA